MSSAPRAHHNTNRTLLRKCALQTHALKSVPKKKITTKEAATKVACNVLHQPRSSSKVAALQKSIVRNLGGKPFSMDSKQDKRSLLTEAQEKSLVGTALAFADTNRR